MSLGRFGSWDPRDHDVFLKIWTQLNMKLPPLPSLQDIATPVDAAVADGAVADSAVADNGDHRSLELLLLSKI